MKPYLIAILFLSASNFASALNIKGGWYGECVQNGSSSESSLYIRYSDDKSISLNDDTFSLVSTTVRQKEGVLEDAAWKEVTVYDWHWSEDKTYIETNAQWLGWYLNQSGTWSGRGTGYIKLNGKKLEVKRDFEIIFGSSRMHVTELCQYDKD